MRASSDLVVDRARASDAAAVESLLDSIAVWLQGRGIDMWAPGRFGDDVRETIANGDLFVGRLAGSLAGCFMLDEGSDRMSRWLLDNGREPTNGVIGRLAVARDFAGRGFGLELLDAAAGVARERRIPYLRLECPAENDGLRRYYLGAGFTYCGDNDTPGPHGEAWISSVFERATGKRVG